MESAIARLIVMSLLFGYYWIMGDKTGKVWMIYIHFPKLNMFFDGEMWNSIKSFNQSFSAMFVIDDIYIEVDVCDAKRWFVQLEYSIQQCTSEFTKI